MKNSDYENNTNVEAQNGSIFLKFPIISVLLIGISGFLVRLAFFQNELIFNSDNLLYFKYAMEVSITGELPTTIGSPNNGWPLILSVFFSILDSNNFLDYMNLQSYLTIIFSTITIIPLYYFARRFLSIPYALFTITIFIFEPRIIQNSLIGVTDPLFILLLVTSLALIVQNNKYCIAIAFAVAAIASTIRVEGLFLILALIVMFFLQFKITKKSIIQSVIFVTISFLVLLPFAIERIENYGNDFFVGRITDSAELFAKQTENDPNQIFTKIINGIYILLEFLGKLMIPYLIIFIPLGIILFIIKGTQRVLLVIPGLVLLIPILYAYTVPALDGRYIFTILPIMCIIGAYSCKIYLEKTRHKKITVSIFLMVILSTSLLFLNYKNTDVEQEEFLSLARIINKNTDTLLYVNTPVFSYLEPAQLLELSDFPVTASHYDKNSKIKLVYYDTEKEFFENIEKNGITHVVIDEEIKNSHILEEIFNNYKNYKNIDKIFDSQENGFNYRIKIFRIL